MSVLVGSTYLQRAHGGLGVLISGVPGVPPGEVVILGGGIVGINAIKMAWGVGARVTVLETNPERMRYIDEVFHGGVTTLASNPHSIESSIENADLVIGAVLIPGHSAPTPGDPRDAFGGMRKGSVLVDVAVDQGGCFETTRATTHSHPVLRRVDGIIHYCVANMPGAVPRTSTFALTNATLNLALALANKGFERAVEEDPHLRAGVNVYKGHITSPAGGPLAEQALYRALRADPSDRPRLAAGEGGPQLAQIWPAPALRSPGAVRSAGGRRPAAGRAGRGAGRRRWRAGWRAGRRGGFRRRPGRRAGDGRALWRAPGSGGCGRFRGPQRSSEKKRRPAIFSQRVAAGRPLSRIAIFWRSLGWRPIGRSMRPAFSLGSPCTTAR